MREALRRANQILAEAKARRRRGRHARKPARHVHRGATLAAAAIVVALGAGVGWTALDGHDPAPAAVATVPVDEAEENYLRELAYAGLALTPAEQAAAVDIAREHVAHGHLVGMRVPILTDFEERTPRLTAEQRDVARVAVEHHFQAVTGRKQ